MSAINTITRSPRHLARLQRPSPLLSQSRVTTRRHESSDGPSQPDHTQRASPAKSSTSPVFYGLGAVLSLVCGYYIFHSSKPAGSGQAAIKEIRRSDDTASPQNEYRDPRDGGVKTLEQKKLKEEGKLR